MGLFGNLFGGDPPQQTQTTTYQLGPEQKQLFNLAFPAIRDYASGPPPSLYPGSEIAGFDPLQTQGQNMVLGATGAQQNIVSGGANASNYWTSPNVWDPANNPALRGAVDAAVRPITEAYTQDFLPALRTDFIRQGGLGGSRQGVHEAVGAEKAQRAIGDTAAKVVQGAYDTNVRAQLQALGLLPQTAQSQTIPGVTTSGVGDVRQAQSQALLNEDVNRYKYGELAPYLQAKDVLSMIPGIPGGSTVSTANNPAQPSGVSKALSGAAAGATLGSAVPFVGPLVGAGLGALLPFL